MAAPVTVTFTTTGAPPGGDGGWFGASEPGGLRGVLIVRRQTTWVSPPL